MKTKMEQTKSEFRSIEEEFFELDHENKEVLIRRTFEKPEEIFDTNAVTKTPLMTEEFIESLIGAFDRVPDKYKLNIRIAFDDLDGYSEEQLVDICRKNFMQETKTRIRYAYRQNRLAVALCGIGLFFILLSIWLGSVWTAESTVRDVVLYILDIVATVPFWGAMEICIIDNRERRRKILNIKRRFHTIEFIKNSRT